MYTDVNVNISDSQKQKIKKALAAGTQLSLSLSHEDLVGNDVIGVTHSQLNRLKKAHHAGKGVTIKMSKSQVAHNMKVQGGFLPKSRKHHKIKLLADKKLNVISDLVSKALDDETISDEKVVLSPFKTW